MIDGDTLPTLHAERIDLRWLTEHDASALFEVFGDPEVVRYWSSPVQTSVAEAHGLVGRIHQAFADRRLFQWGICVREGGQLIGTCTLAGLDPDNLRAELGFALRRDRWGQGYGSEAVDRVLEYAFEGLGLRRIEADTDPRNDASNRLLERLGFEREGYLRERWRVAGQVCDSVILGLLRRDWRARRRGHGGAGGERPPPVT